MTNSHSLSLVLVLSIFAAACISDDGAALEPDAGPAPSCEQSPLEVEARRICAESCRAAAAATDCAPDDVDDFDRACGAECITTEIPDRCVAEAARFYGCLAQQPWSCGDGATKPAIPVGACLLVSEVLADCVKGDGS